MGSLFRNRAAMLAALAAALVVGPSTREGARADEAFLCGPDSIIYVKPSEIELKKKTDPCVARSYGLTVEQPAEAAPPSGKVAQGAEKPSDKSEKQKPVALKALQSPETAERVSREPERTAAIEPPTAAPGTDFRNVKVINAGSPGDQWFKHTR